LLDIMMLGMDGFETLSRLRASFSPDILPIMIISACADGSDIVRGLTSGANDYVLKPIERTTFLARVYNHVSLSRARRALDEHREMLRRLLEIQHAIGNVMLEAILVHNADGRLVYGNTLLREVCNGVEPASVQEVFEILFPKDLTQQLMREVPVDRERPFEKEFQLPQPFTKNVIVRSRVIRVGESETLRLWAFQDITQVRELESRMQVQVQLESVGKFVHGAAHIFNNVFSGVLCSANLIKRLDTSGDPKIAKCIQTIERCVSAGARFTDKMAAMVTGKRVFEGAQSEDLREVLRVLVEAAQLNIGERITFVLETDEELPAVPFNIRNLAVIFGNVLSNAVDAIPETGVITIVAKKDPVHGKVQVTFKDSGTGMDENTARRVHEPFFSTKRLDIRHGVSCEGRGLGMWNVYNLVRASGGDVCVKSEPGKGTDVVVSLPAEDPASCS
jgi:signal transduction histidine kinase